MKTAQTGRWGKIIETSLLIILFIALVLTVLIQADPGNKTPARDSGIFIYIGNEILHGKLPYRDAWDNKPPAVFYLDAFALWIGHGTRWGVWFIELISMLAALYFAYRVMKEMWGTWPAIFALLFFSYELDRSLLGGNLTEEYPLPLHFISLMLFLKLLKDPENKLLNFLLGLSFGIVFLFRANNAMTEVAIVIVLLIVQLLQKKFRNLLTQLLWMGIGAVIPVGLTVLYFWSQGAVQGLLDGSILYNLTYSDTRFTTSSPFTIGFYVLGSVVWVAAFGYLVAALRIFPKSEYRFVYLFLLIGWPMAIYLSDPAKRNYDHYYMNWLPFITLLAGLAFHFVVSKLSVLNKDPVWWRIAGAALAIVITLAFFISDGRAEDYHRAYLHFLDRANLGIQSRTPISIYVSEHTKPGNLVLFWGEYPGENYMSGRETASPVLFYPLQVPSPITSRLDDQFLQDLKQNRPIMIVDMVDFVNFSLNPAERLKQHAPDLDWPYPPDNLNDVFTFIDQNYSFAANVKGHDIYILKGSQ